MTLASQELLDLGDDRVHITGVGRVTAPGESYHF
jgi:hypothetical protein